MLGVSEKLQGGWMRWNEDSTRYMRSQGGSGKTMKKVFAALVSCDPPAAV